MVGVIVAMMARDSSTCTWPHSQVSCCVLNGIVRMKLGVLFSTLVRGLLPLLLLLDVGPTNALDIAQCRNMLGMQSYEIPDSAITASSSYDMESVGPSNARIRTEIHGGAWCPSHEISKEVYEYLQIDLGQLRVITLVETQGRFGNGQGQEYADQYLLEYQREPDGVWFRFRNRRAQEIFQGNTNTYIAELREVDPPIIARKIRFIPYSENPKTICMRVELYGCTWEDGVVMYNMYQGERRGTEVDLLDFTYDGKLQGDQLTGGLGQLMDGEEGETNFRLDPMGFGIKGYEWVGWRNRTHTYSPMEIIFKFDDVRNFTALKIHSNNLFSKDVRVFKSADIYFSIGGQHYLNEPIKYNYMRDSLIEYARWVSIPINHTIGRFVKVHLHFDSKWMMISEVQFESEYAVGNFTEEVLPTTPVPVNEKEAGKNPTIVQVDLIPGEQTHSGGGEKNGHAIPAYEARPDDSSKSSGSSGGSGSGGGNQVGHSHTTDNKQTIKGDGDSNQDNAATGDGAANNNTQRDDGDQDGSKSEDVIDSSREKKSLDDEYIGIIIGALSALILLLFIVIFIIIWRQRQRKYNNNHRVMKPTLEPRHVTLDLNDLQTNTLNGKVINGNMYNCVSMTDGDSDREPINKVDNYGNKVDIYGTPLDCIQQRKLPAVPPGMADNTLTRDYATIPDVKKSALGMVPNIPPQAVPSAPPMIYQATYGHAPVVPSTGPVANGSHYAASDIVNIPNIQGVSGNNVYAVPNPDLLWSEDFSVMEFPRENLQFAEKLGEGQFGEVHLCEAQNITDFLGDDFLVNRTESRSLLVAVKMLRRTADDKARRDFQKEVKIMASLKDPNIVRVLGMITKDEPFSVIVEYMKLGDLHQFLQHHTLENTLPKRRNARGVTYGCLIYMASQIASGMKYLENLNMVHRDLATRNCLVGTHFTIKISDFGMSRSLYSCDYYRIEGKAVLPIRWMAWESILLGKFSTKSDVWSFGVTLWEVLSFAREQPFDNMTDEQVIENCGHYYRNDGLEMYLPQPANCPREIYDLMRECWNREDVQRPAFKEIHMFLQRKNMGYDPKQEKSFTPVV